MSRTKTVPALVFLLGLTAIAAIVLLQGRAADDRQAQLQLAGLRIELSQLQGAPLKASAQTGGSPAVARAGIDRGMSRVNQTLAALHRSPVPALDGVGPPLRADYRVLEEIYALGTSGLPFNETAKRAAPLVGVAASQTERVDAVLSSANDQYDSRASAADNRATVGSAVAILLLLFAFGLFYRRSVRLGQENARLAGISADEARTDALTGLRNRRALIGDLEAEAHRAGGRRELVLGLFDLNGFKQYNDTFGHPAGDALLTRLADQLRDALGAAGTAYRMGGDEFCTLAPAGPADAPIVRLAAEALKETGDAFTIDCSYGVAMLPAEADSAGEALRLADQRMYEHKAAGRSSASQQSSDVLLKVLSERNAELREHLSGVARFAELTAERLGLSEQEVRHVGLAAELHDVGKTAIPDNILDKPGPLDDHEWEFMHRHTIIGERILLAAPSLAVAASLVRSSHERYDGGGYPDGLVGAAVPLGASIIAVCDSYDAMISDRPYRAAMGTDEAMAELHRCSGAQFDPAIVDVFCELVADLEMAAA